MDFARVQPLGLPVLCKPFLGVNAISRVLRHLAGLQHGPLLNGFFHHRNRATRIDVEVALLVIWHIRIQQQVFIELVHDPLGNMVIHRIGNAAQQRVGIAVVQLHRAKGIRRIRINLTLRNQRNIACLFRQLEPILDDGHHGIAHIGKLHTHECLAHIVHVGTIGLVPDLVGRDFPVRVSRHNHHLVHDDLNATTQAPVVQ